MCHSQGMSDFIMIKDLIWTFQHHLKPHTNFTISMTVKYLSAMFTEMWNLIILIGVVFTLQKAYFKGCIIVTAKLKPSRANNETWSTSNWNWSWSWSKIRIKVVIKVDVKIQDEHKVEVEVKTTNFESSFQAT